MRFPQALAATLEAGGSVIASSPRAARALRQIYGERQREQGRTAWRAAEIAHWEGWLESLWQQELRAGNESRLLLSTLQEHEIWVRLVKPSIEGRRLISIDGVAELAQDAYELLCVYDSLQFLRGELFGGIDVEHFRSWARGFEQECLRAGWLSRSMLPLALSEATSRLHLPGTIALVGFDRIAPAGQRLIEACRAQGCSITRIENQNQPAGIEALVQAADTRDEITTCAWWARRKLELAATGGRRVRIAVIAPDPGKTRTEMKRIFRQVLAPRSVPIGAPESALPFEFSLGVPLAEVPLARAALLLLRWMNGPLLQEELTWLLLSGFLWREESDLLPVAALDANLRKTGVLPPEQELASFLERTGGLQTDAAARLRHRLYAARRAKGREEALHFAGWETRAEQILEAAGWPGPYRMGVEDFQAQAKWTQLLESVALLSFDERRVPYGEFLNVLERQARRTIFAPQSHDAPVQILGPLEAAGLEFDAIWFLGADDRSWPTPGQPHPFLLRSLQEQRAMPHAARNADWELARLVTERLRRSAEACVFSYAQQAKDGQQRPSTVLTADPTLESKAISSLQFRERLAIDESSLDSKREPAPLPPEQEQATVLPWPREQDAGGHDVLKRQAACPFQAFATFRLGAREIDRSDWGLDPSDRGKLLHTVLEDVWGELKDRDSLLQAKSGGTLRGTVERHLDHALYRYRGKRAAKQGDDAEENLPRDEQERQERWSAAYLSAERQRVLSLVEEWLDYETRRTRFTVEQHEQNLAVRVGELRLRLRTDRIDQVDGGRLLIDYKTGKVKTSGWEGERPEEPQLPLYAAYGNVADLRGALLARVRAGETQFEGCVDKPEETLMPGLSKPLRPFSEETRQQWRAVLLRLGEEFLNGEAQVDPRQYPKTCELCALPGLCRIAETEHAWTDPEQNGIEQGAIEGQSGSENGQDD